MKIQSHSKERFIAIIGCTFLGTAYLYAPIVAICGLGIFDKWIDFSQILKGIFVAASISAVASLLFLSLCYLSIRDISNRSSVKELWNFIGQRFEDYAINGVIEGIFAIIFIISSLCFWFWSTVWMRVFFAPAKFFAQWIVLESIICLCLVFIPRAIILVPLFLLTRKISTPDHPKPADDNSGP